SLMISAGYKVHPLWQSYEMLPLFSLLTAFIMGFSIVIFEGSLVQAGLRSTMKIASNTLMVLVSLTNRLFSSGPLPRRPACTSEP
ncbi:hypothetical protein ACUOFC_61445, partial [Escherichia sp. TWPC-MK]